jgi:hypothetical protein
MQLTRPSTQPSRALVRAPVAEPGRAGPPWRLRPPVVAAPLRSPAGFRLATAAELRAAPRTPPSLFNFIGYKIIRYESGINRLHVR